ncbi:MAG: DMT family transporter [Planctomycetota bacterium]
MASSQGSAPSRTRTVALTALTLAAFAGNSLLARAALVEGTIGAPEFTALRIASGAAVLLPFAVRATPRLREERLRRLRAAAWLALYAIAFSLAYLELAAGTGALLLFGAVQVTMITSGLRAGERATPARALGFLMAIAGLVWLVLPGVDAPAPWAAAAMALAGIAWGAYTLSGRGEAQASAATAWNFLLATPLTLPLVWFAGDGRWSVEGSLLAIASGALTSGAGYVVWYAALRGHSAISAALVQLLVPALAALGGAALLGESIDLRLVGSSCLTLGGVALAILTKARPRTA